FCVYVDSFFLCLFCAVGYCIVFLSNHSFSISYFFYLVIHQTPRCTLFPYTTLFRSLTLVRWVQAPRSHSQWSSSLVCRPSISPPDRKSTRLNSSHVSISYAVFCLKKKKA